MKFNLTSTLESASRIASKFAFKAKKHSPEVLMIVGTVSIIAGTVTACKATMKLPEIIDKAGEDIDQIHGGLDGTVKLKKGETYTEDEARRDLTITYTQTAVKVVKLYAFPAFLIAGGIACMFGSHHIMVKRNAEAVAAYTAVTQAFAEYKNRVKERFGEDVQNEIEQGIKAVEVDTGEVDENGNPKKETVKVKKDDTNDPYSILFDESNRQWQPDRDYNRIFVQQVENAANAKLKRKGYLFLNDVIDMLGFERGTPIGQFAGWIYDPTNPDIDSRVDFGMYNPSDPEKVAFLEGNERNIWLHFNVDGNILNKI